MHVNTRPFALIIRIIADHWQQYDRQCRLANVGPTFGCIAVPDRPHTACNRIRDYPLELSKPWHEWHDCSHDHCLTEWLSAHIPGEFVRLAQGSQVLQVAMQPL